MVYSITTNLAFYRIYYYFDLWHKRYIFFCTNAKRKRSYLELLTLMYRSNRSFNMPSPPPRASPGHLTFLKIFVPIPPYPGQNAVQMPHTRVHSGDQMPPPRGHFTGTKMTEGRRKRLQLSNKIFINITKTEKHC